MMKRHIIFYIMWILVLFMSCNHTNQEITKDVKRMMSKPVNLCEGQLTLYKSGIEMKDTTKHNSMFTQVVFVDSATCSSCFWKQMPHWQSIIDSVKHHNIDLSFLFVFHVKHRNKQAFIKTMQHDTLFRHPIYLDTAGVFLRQNPIISRNKLLHSFLINQDNHVILVGCPMQNRRIRDMFNDILLKTEKNERTSTVPNYRKHRGSFTK